MLQSFKKWYYLPKKLVLSKGIVNLRLTKCEMIQ